VQHQFHQKIKAVSGGTTRSLGREGIAHHKINLPGFENMPALDDPAKRLVFLGILKEDIAGKTVLDLGCNIGGFCFEALQLGAKSVHGIDIMKERIEVAQEIAKSAKIHRAATFETMDIVQIPDNIFYDVVLCLQTFDYVEPRNVLAEKLCKITKKALYLEMNSPLSSSTMAIFTKGFKTVENLHSDKRGWMNVFKMKR